MRFDAIASAWRRMAARQRMLLAGGCASIVVVALAGGAFVAVASGGDDDATVKGPVPTATPTSTPMPPTPTAEDFLRYLAAIMPTPTAPARASSGGGGGGAAPSSGGGGSAYVNRGGTGPGPIVGTDMRLSVPKIGVNASVYSRYVGSNGQMGNPAGAWDVIWYDFSGFGGMGGRPEEAGANVVMAGHVDYIRVGPAVFYSIRNLAAGDVVTVTTSQGTYNYQVQWSAWAGPTEDFGQYVSKTGEDSITLVTCVGEFSAGHYSNRLIVRGVRI